jgi:phage terminase large subunit-like protein
VRTVITSGSTFENAKNLSPTALEDWINQYEGTRLGRQELQAEILDDAENALWTHAMLDALRVHTVPCQLTRVVVAVDPSAGSKKTNDEQGIGVVGLGTDGHLYVLADRTCKLSPDGWAEAAVQAAIDYGADCIVGEINCGGEMVGALTHGAMTRMGVHFRYQCANAKMGKGLRAEPVSAIYEQGKAHHVGLFAKLEDEMCLLSPFGYQGTKSPNRIDAVVWAATDLLPGVYQAKAITRTISVKAIQIDEEDRKEELTAAQVAQLPDPPLASAKAIR